MGGGFILGVRQRGSLATPLRCRLNKIDSITIEELDLLDKARWE